ncbi:MAG: response regulator [Deltaproteobacteria bacterium]|nr:response regulator [Deltaproteobacteria bacterium]
MNQRKPIGKILLEQRKITQEQLGQALERQQQSGGRLASNLLDLGLAGEQDLLKALGEQLGLPAVDLARSIIPLCFLDIIPENVAVDSVILPLYVDDERILLAMSSPDNKQILDEVGFVSGRRVEPYVAIESRIRACIREAYALRKRDPALRFFQGEQAQFPEGQESPNGYIAILAQQLPEPDVDFQPEEELITIEVSLEDEIPVDLELDAAQEGRSSRQVVLVVDDEADITRMLQKTLEKEGFEVLTASRGLEALQAVKKGSPNLVLLDAMLPEIHGFEICKKIKSSKRYGHIPVIMISAIYRGWRYAQDAKDTYGADDYFEKPFRLVPLVRRVRELLDAGPPEAVEPQSDPDAANAAYQRGVGYYQQKRYDEAYQELEEARQLDPFSANVHYAMANVLLARNQVYEAMRAYEQTVELKPDLFVPLRNLAILYQRKGFRNKAVEMWERALRCSPEGEKQQVREQLLKLL